VLYCGSDFTSENSGYVRLLPPLLSVFLILFSCCFVRGQLHQQCCEEWTLVSEETQAKMARMAAAAAWGLGEGRKEFLFGVRQGVSAQRYNTFLMSDSNSSQLQV